MQVHDLLLSSADRVPDRAYVRDHHTIYQYSLIADHALRIARFLVRDGSVHRGDRVALLWPNSAEAVAAAFGVWIAGGVLVPLSTDISTTGLAHHLSHSAARVFIYHKRFSRLVADVTKRLSSSYVQRPVTLSDDPSADTSYSAVSHSSPPISSPVRSIDIDRAAIIYTSGSTGHPKGVILSHLNLTSNTRSIVSYLGLSDRDSVMMVLPHFYIFGLSLLLTHAMVGGTVILDNRFAYPATVLAHMQQASATGFAGVPSTYSMLLERTDVEDLRFPSLRYVCQAGGAMPPPTQKRVAAAFAPASLYVMYGATEAAPRLSYLDPEDLPRKWGSIGKPVPNVDLFVANEEGIRVPAGTEGELVARGSNITEGYWKDPEETAAVLRQGLYFTGDMGYEDEDGFLFVTGRRKEFLKVKGYRVSPVEIEEALVALPEISSAAVIGVPHHQLGEAPVAFVVPTGDVSVDASTIIAALRRQLPSHKVPVTIASIESLPKTASGKIDKPTLRERYDGSAFLPPDV